MTLSELTIQHPGGQRTFYYRPGTSDINIINQTFRDKAFDMSGLKRWPDIKRWYDAQERCLIVDAGANIGTAAVYFALTYPKAGIAAFEPEHSNCFVLRQNSKDLDIDASNLALSKHELSHVEVYHPEGQPTERCGHAGYRTRPAEFGPAGVTMDFILSIRLPAPFIAKIDIEGAESDVFSGDTSWIDRFPVLIVELHDWLYPKQRLAQSFLQAIAPLDRDFVLHGEHVISIRNDL